MKLKRDSKTMRTAAVIAALGVAEVNWHMMQTIMGDWYGVSYILIGGLVAYLRIITTGPVE